MLARAKHNFNYFFIRLKNHGQFIKDVPHFAPSVMYYLDVQP